MHIVFAAPECAPCVKTGGLGEVLGALPRAIAQLGHRVTVYLPYYRAVQHAIASEPNATVPPVVLSSITIPAPEANRFIRVFDGGQREEVQTYLVDCPEFFDRDGVYGPPGENYPDNALRFGSYCRAVLEASKLLGVPDVFHLHDWQAAFVSIFLQTTFATDPLLGEAATVYTIHNGGYQGLFAREQLADLLLPQELFTNGELATEGKVNPFLGALRYSDAVTTVSPSYAEELRTPAFGEGLDGIYRERGDEFTGILNGIDEEEWDPQRDPHLAAHYSKEDLSGKEECRRDLLHAFAMGETGNSTAVIGMVSRLAAQKGFDLIAEAMPQLVELDLLLLVVGSGEPELEESFRALADRYPDHLRISPGFQETLAHKVQAGADMTLMPSRYEPSGLTQMYSLRYGTVPIVRATGGLLDTVDDGPEGDGFAFAEYTVEALVGAVERALAEFANTARWQERMRRGMGRTLTWEKPAQDYIAVYERAVAAHGSARNS